MLLTTFELPTRPHTKPYDFGNVLVFGVMHLSCFALGKATAERAGAVLPPSILFAVPASHRGGAASETAFGGMAAIAFGCCTLDAGRSRLGHDCVGMEFRAVIR